MALLPTETWRGGFVVDTTTGKYAITTSLTNAVWWGGFLRDPDGRLVVTYA
jgi:hypothetical protein